MRYARQKQEHRAKIEEALKVKAYYDLHTKELNNTEIARHFGHEREWLRRMLIRAAAASQEKED